MECKVLIDDCVHHRCRALVVGCFEGEVFSDPLLRSLDAVLAGALEAIVDQGEFGGQANKSLLVHTLGKGEAERLFLVGLGKRREATPERFRRAAGSALQALSKAGVQRFASVLHEAGDAAPEVVRATAEGFYLGNYSFDCYKSEPLERSVCEEVTFLTRDEVTCRSAEDVIRETALVCGAVAFTRDLVTHPGNVATPAYLAERALEMSGRMGVECRVLEREEIERLGMEAFLSVAKGSRQPPRFIVLEYRGGKQDARPIVLVGKGVTFDSGGISLKPRDGMERMKDDMAGGAAVLGAIQAAAGLRLPVNIVGLVPTAENLPDGGAYKPGDVVRTMAGKTVEVVNTDAEGRMLLCDALYYAQRYRPSVLIDVATLTGACVVALGTCATGLMGNDNGLKRALRQAGETTGERLWELPLWEEYGELMKSDIADLKNAGGPTAGTITAGWFLGQFVGKYRWAHLDIAGTAWEDKGGGHLPKGATGCGVRLLVEFLKGTLK
ncbi:MAG TPA: leucyl aminopeptidase [Geobacteraceae bacterium]